MKTTTYTHPALVADRVRRVPVPTFVGLRGGAVSIDGFRPARDSARARVPMV